MENMKLSFLLHFYQPYWQYESVLDDIVNQCYRPILDIVHRSSGFCLSINVNLCLLELLEKHHSDVVISFKEAVDQGKLELLGSTAHHPIIPLIPRELQWTQLQEDYEIKKNHFDITPNCQGVFLPEMAFSEKDINVLIKHSYRWTVLDDEPFNTIHGYVPYNFIVNSWGIDLFMRSRYWSNMISSGQYNFNEIRDKMTYELPNWTENNPAYLIMAMDAETFGHHHKHLIDSFLRPMLDEWSNYKKLVPITEIRNWFPSKNCATMPDGSWSTTRDDINLRNDPYPLWKSRFNKYHSMLWELVNGALTFFNVSPIECLQMTSSCHWWWISGKPYWKPEFMKIGAEKAMSIIRCHASEEEIIWAKDTYDTLMKLE